jgi:hypothetical protein
MEHFRQFVDLLDSDGGQHLLTVVLFFAVAGLIALGVRVEEDGVLYGILLVLFRAMSSKGSSHAVVAGTRRNPPLPPDSGT